MIEETTPNPSTEILRGFTYYVSIEDEIDDDWHSVKLTYDSSYYEEGAAVTNQGVSIWVDGTLRAGSSESFAVGVFGPSSAAEGEGPIRLGVLVRYEKDEDLPSGINYVGTPLAQLRVCDYIVFDSSFFEQGRFPQVNQQRRLCTRVGLFG